MLSSNRRVEAGCMVLIIGACRLTDNVGKMGTAVKVIHPGDKLPNGRRFNRDVTHSVWLVEGQGLVAFTEFTTMHTNFTLSKECYLLPIYPDEHKDEKHEQDRTLSKTR